MPEEDSKTTWDIDYTIHYKYWHSNDPGHVESMASHVEWMIKGFLPPGLTGRALDIGCGTGFALIALRNLGFAAEGVDIDPGQIAECKKLGLQADVCSNVERFLEEREQTYSMVLMLDLLEHIPVHLQVALVRKVYRSLVPGGMVVVQVPNAGSILASRYRYIDFTHYCSFTEHSLRFLLMNGGFNELIIPGATPQPRPSLRLWRADARRSFFPVLRRKLFRWLWRQAILSELGDTAEAHVIPLELNLTWAAQRVT